MLKKTKYSNTDLKIITRNGEIWSYDRIKCNTYISIGVELPLVGSVEQIHHVLIFIADVVDDPVCAFVVNIDKHVEVAEDW